MPLVKDIPRGRTRFGVLRFASAIRYAATVNDRTSEIAAVSERFSASIDHAATPELGPDHDRLRGERIERVLLWRVFSLETAAIELDAIAALRPGVSDPMRHLVLSYDTARGERPSWDEVESDVKTLLRHRGFTDAQDRGQRHHTSAAARFEAARRGEVSPYVAIVHGDTDSKHVHIICCTVAPNGAVNSDFRSYGANEHAAAMIALAHGWEIVAGRTNGKLVAEQARGRGASEAEIAALLRRDAATLDRLRERDQGGTRRSGAARGDAGASARRGGFISEYGKAIRSAFSSARSFDEFRDALRDVGVIAKFSEVPDRKTGRVLPRLAFADALDKAGDSGSRVGVTAKMVVEKFRTITTDRQDPASAATARASSTLESVRDAAAGLQPARQDRFGDGDVGAPASGERITSPSPPPPEPAHSLSQPSGGVVTSHQRALAIAALRRGAAPSGRSGSLDWTLAVLGFASGSMRAVRHRRQERQSREPQATVDRSRNRIIEPSEPSNLEDAGERLSRRRATILARDVRTAAGIEARDRALADLDMRASYAVWRREETKRQLVGIRVERAEAYDAHRRETRFQLQRAWHLEKLFRDALRSRGMRDDAARRAMSEAYDGRRSAILASRKNIWAAVAVVRPEVKPYADWLKEQSGVVADRARAQFEADVHSRSAKSGTVERVQQGPVTSEVQVEPPHTTDTASREDAPPKAAPHRSNRFAAIFDRSDADARIDEAAKRAGHGTEQVEKARAERDAAIERSMVKAAGKILGTAGHALIDELCRISHGPQRTAAVAKLRETILSAGVQRRSRRAVGVPQARGTRRPQRSSDSPSR